MAYLCDIYTDEDEYEVYLEKMIMRPGRYLTYRKNGQPQETICRISKSWTTSKENILRACGISQKEFSFSWR